MNDYKCKSPVLFLVFNRPDVTAQVFERIREAQPSLLYVAADGPRADREGEAVKCQQVRDIATAVDWNCEVKTLFRDQNLGCAAAVSEAINWFFEKEEEGIILEDDVLVHPTWFQFVDEMLERYRFEDEVMCVTAHSHDYPVQEDASYAFSIYNHCWGWATWRRAWQNYDHELKEWVNKQNSDWLEQVGDGSRAFACYWKERFDSVLRSEVDSWAYRWTCSVWIAGGISIHPARNMMENIGFGTSATHTKNRPERIDRTHLMHFPLKHPTCPRKADASRDRYIGKVHFGITRTYKLRKMLNQFRSYRLTKDLVKKIISRERHRK